MVAGNSRLKTSKSPTRIPVNFSLDECLDESGGLPKGVVEDWSAGGHWQRRKGRFRAKSSYKSKIINLGRFETPEEAGRMYQEFNKDKEKWLRDRGKL